MVLAKLLAMALAAAWGFSHVSDDDYARTVIAQSFAHAPKLDPSGTSWLPLPFWIAGAAMKVAGRSLEVARGIAWTLGALSAVGPFFALRRLQIAPIVAWSAAATAALSPWSVWLASATVPEGWAASLAATALLLAAASDARASLVAAALMGAATLCRYEAWPLAAWLAAVLAWRAVRVASSRAVHLTACLLALAGPVAWMAWNAHAHGDALHFFARVASFRKANGLAPAALSQRLFGYPIALVTWFPEALLGVAALALARGRRAWVVPSVGCALGLAFLVYGDVKDGAPTHHPERALGALASVLACAGVVAVGRLERRARRVVAAIASVAWASFVLVRLHDPPGNSPSERRDEVLARGRALAIERPREVVVIPCQYEHFALIAAFGAPERVRIEAAVPSSPPTACPRVVTR